MAYASINIQGNIISSDILSKVSQDDIRFQKPIDFGLDRNISVREEIGIAWGIAHAHWKGFRIKKENLSPDDTGTTITRNNWIVPFMQALGYDLNIAKAEMINDKSYAISHRAVNKNGFPVHIVGVNQSLDKRAEHGARLSPHALVQEYLNNHEHLYAITTNGSFLRVLRDATRLSRLSYLEFDLARIMEEELYAEFALLFRVIHATRFPEKQDEGADCIFEFYHQEALASGTRIRERLSIAVEQSIKLFGNGLLQHPANTDLRERVNNMLSADNYYFYLLRTVYRILFLLVIEERNLIFPEKRDEDLQKKRKFYYQFYSIQRLTKLAERRVYVDPHKTDLWDALLSTFRLFEKEKYANKLGLQALGSGLFAHGAIGILEQQRLNNKTVLGVLRYLVMFENENKQWTRVNYADLDVEEFGSVYEGLLDYDPQIKIEHGMASFSFVVGDGRSSSGSHYTPEELVKPLIKHSLDYIIKDKLKEGKAKGHDETSKMIAQCEALLTITVCDVACGSGHILLSAARRIGMELAILRESLEAKSKVEQPSPTFLRQAIRDVIRHCIYGVDLNPLAVELCKVALWLEAHNPNEPLNFLDHHIKCGNAIVGLAHIDELENNIPNEAFKALTLEEKNFKVATMNERTAKISFASHLAKKNKTEQFILNADAIQLKAEFEELAANTVQETMTKYDAFKKLPEKSPEEINKKQEAYNKFINGKGYLFLKTMCDTQIAQFFIEKTEKNQGKFITSNEFAQMLKGYKSWTGPKTAMATRVGVEKHFFHWFLEFPEVFANGGFDCILGNPPYLGGTKISTFYGKTMFNYLVSKYFPAAGRCDLIGYFVRNIDRIVKVGGFYSLITTNTISEGDTREGSLDIVLEKSSVNHAVKSMLWPGSANVVITLLSVFKGDWNSKYYLNGEWIKEPINAYLTNDKIIAPPNKLFSNSKLAYMGCSLTGDGFIIKEDTKNKLLAINENYSKVVLPYLNGQSLNNSYVQSSGLFAINFWDFEEDYCKEKYPEIYEIVHSSVRLEREQKSEEVRKAPWWQYWRVRKELYEKLEGCEYALIQTRASKTHAFLYVPKEQVFSDALVVVASNSNHHYSVLNSSLHESWAWQFSSKLKSDRRYSISDAFQTFPFPINVVEGLILKGEEFNKQREKALKTLKIGITAIANKISNKFEIDSLIQKLRHGIKEMDEAVLAAYGWQDIDLRHDFYAVDYLPENDRVRYTIHPDARKEVLKRLLLLNHKRFEEEVAEGLHKRKEVEAFYQQKGESVPAGTIFSDVKAKKYATRKAKVNKVEEPRPEYGIQSEMFAEPVATKTIGVGSQVSIKKTDGTILKYILLKNAVKGTFTGDYKQINITSALAQAMLNKSVGDRFEFGGEGYEIKKIL